MEVGVAHELHELLQRSPAAIGKDAPAITRAATYVGGLPTNRS
jgi:hypothetical protein